MSLYPGSNNVQPIERLGDHLAAMLDLDSGEAPLVELDGRLIDESQRALARLSVPERAYGLLKSQALTSTAGDWTAARRGGSDVATVFETISGQPLDTVRVPEFFTYSGFHNIFLASLTDISERIRRERWVLGSAGEQLAVSTQFDNLPDQMLELYTRDFLAAWRNALAKLRLRKVLADKPKYIVLSALAAPTSPLNQLFESIRDETMLTRERAAPPPAGGGAPATSPAKPPAQLPLFKTQDRAPGANIEAQFRAFHAVLEGGATRAPVDDIVSTLNLIRQNLILSATTPSQVGRANVTLQELISTVRNSAARLPKPFSDHMLAAVREFEGDVATSSAEQVLLALRNQVIPFCQPTIGGRYPFTRGGDREVPLGDFAHLFAPNGVLDAFFTQYLKPHVDVSKAQWTWQPGAAVATTLSPAMLKSFQDASRIRDAYFPSGGNQPMVSIAIHPPQAPAGWIVKFETGGYVITSPSSPTAPAPGPLGPLTPKPPSPPPAAGSPSPSTVQWPGASPRTAVSVAAEGGGPSSVLDKTGPWSLFRVLEAGSLSVRAETATATFIVGGQELRYQITAGSIRNPLNLAVLREFRCPIGN
jgi:type VI secretion system protein ImpL